jgi:hypothetical protein
MGDNRPQRSGSEVSLLEQAINADDGGRADKLIQHAHGIEFRRCRELLLPEDLAGRSRAARPHRRRSNFQDEEAVGCRT